MPHYHAKFHGCTRGAIGIHYPIEAFTEGADPEAAWLALYARFDHIGRGSLVELPIRYVVTHLGPDGLRVLSQAAQGRNTYDTAEAAQEWIDAMQASAYAMPESLEVRAVPCWPGHFDPTRTVFD